MKTNIGNFFENLIKVSSENARKTHGEEHIKNMEKNLEEQNWQEIYEKHGFKKKEISNLKNYIFESLISYLKNQEKKEDLFDKMSKEKINNGESKKYIEIKNKWQEQKKILFTYNKSADKNPEKIKTEEISPQDFIRKYNLGSLKRKHRNFLLDKLTENYTKKKRWVERNTKTQKIA